LLSLIRLNHAPHPVVYAAFVQVLVGLCLVLVLVSHPHQQQSPLSTINRYLPDYLVETLLVKLLSHRAKSDLPGLLLDQSFVELFAELDDLYFGGWGGQYGLDPELAVVCLVLLRRQYLGENVLGMMGVGLFFVFVVVPALAG
jgi:hypothetical protein